VGGARELFDKGFCVLLLEYLLTITLVLSAEPRSGLQTYEFYTAHILPEGQ
jgi:hypothetical protein